MNKYSIPKYLDEPYKIVFFTIDEFVLLIVPVIVSMKLVGSPMIGMFIGTVLVAVLKNIKGREGHNQLLRQIYWHFPPIIRFKSTPPSYQREILG